MADRPTAACRAYIGLGSNLQQPLRQVTTALAEIDQLPGTRVLKASPWYRSAAVGPGTQPDYINGAALVSTTLAAPALLEELQGIEQRHGRERTLRWGARTLDLDILLYGDLQLDSERLTVPHPRLRDRNFVLYPLADLTPDLVMPDGVALRDLLANVSPQGIVRLDSDDIL